MRKRLRNIIALLLGSWLILTVLHGLSGYRGWATSALSKRHIREDARMSEVTRAFLAKDTLYIEFRDELGKPMSAHAQISQIADDFGEPMPFGYERLQTLPSIKDSIAVPVVGLPTSINYHSDREVLEFLKSGHGEQLVIGVSKETAGYQIIGLAIPLPRFGDRGEMTLRRPWNPGGFYRTPADWAWFILLYPFAVIGDILTFWIVPLFP